jgi:nicotinamide riboside kinase
MAQIEQKAIIIEGPDGSGKSVMAHKLGKLLARNVLKYPGPPDSVHSEDCRIKGSIKSLGEPVIMDRAPFITSIVYAPIIFPNLDPFVTIEMAREVCGVWRPVIYFCNRYVDNAQKPDESDEYYRSIQDARWSIVTKYEIIMSVLADVTCVVEVKDPVKPKIKIGGV